MLEHKGSTTPSRHRGKGAGGISNHSLLPNPSTQTQIPTDTPTKTASSLLNFLDFVPQRQRGGTVDRLRDHTRRDLYGMVDAGGR